MVERAKAVDRKRLKRGVGMTGPERTDIALIE